MDRATLTLTDSIIVTDTSKNNKQATLAELQTAIGGGGGFVSNAQVPLPSRLDTPDSMQAYVVQSQLQGQMNAQGRLDSQIIL